MYLINKWTSDISVKKINYPTWRLRYNRAPDTTLHSVWKSSRGVVNILRIPQSSGIFAPLPLENFPQSPTTLQWCNRESTLCLVQSYWFHTTHRTAATPLCGREAGYKSSSENKTSLHHAGTKSHKFWQRAEATDAVEKHPFKVLFGLLDSKWWL